MIKKKAKGKKIAKKAAKKKSSPKKKERNPAAVRNEIAKIVESSARAITQAVVGQAKTGQLAPAKYLFEMASIFPALTDGSFSTAHEESMAETLMRRLDLPDKPIAKDDEDEPRVVGPADEVNVKVVPADEEKESGAPETQVCDEEKDPQLV
jgi:hypothetical protein